MTDPMMRLQSIDPSAAHFGIRRNMSPNARGTVTGILKSVKNACIWLKRPNVLCMNVIASPTTISPRQAEVIRPTFRRALSDRSGFTTPLYMSCDIIDETML